MIKIDADQLRELSSAFAAPRWLRDLGIASWLLAGVAALLVGLTFLLAVTAVIVVPVIVGLICASIAMPVVNWLQRKRVPRAAGAILVLLGFVALGVVILLLVLGGLVGQSGTIGGHLDAAGDKVQSWVEDAGVSTSGASNANDNVTSGISSTIPTFVKGLANAVQGITSLVFFVVFTAFSLLFLLKDGPVMRAWVDAHMGVPRDVARTISGDVISSLRGISQASRSSPPSTPSSSASARSCSRAAGGHHRRGDVRHGVHPVHRRLRLGRVRGAAGARRRGHVDRVDHARHRAARQRLLQNIVQPIAFGRRSASTH